MKNSMTAKQASIFRFKVRLGVFFGPERQRLKNNYTLNMSTGGVFIETNEIFPVDTPLIVEFTLPGDKFVTCDARVAWTNEAGALKKPSFPPGMGVQFLGLSPEWVRAIQNFLKKCDLEPV